MQSTEGGRPAALELYAAERGGLRELLRSWSLPAGGVLFEEGDPSDSIYLVERGVVAIEASAADHSRVGLQILGPGGVIPGAIVGAGGDAAPRVGAAVARAPSEGLVVDAAELASLCAEASPAAFSLLALVAALLCEELRQWTQAGDTAISGLATQPEGEVSVPSAEHREFLRILPFFQRYSAEQIDALLPLTRQWELPPGAQICAEGAPGGACYLILRGAVEVAVLRAGRRQRLAVVGPGRMIGQIALIDRGPRSTSAWARDRTVLLEIPAESFDGLVASGGALGLELLLGVTADLMAAHAETARRVARARCESAVVGLVPGGGRHGAEIGGEAWERASRQALIERVSTSIIGDGTVLEGPFGPRRLVYTDYTASGRSLSFIEDFIRRDVLPLYANTHTESSGTGRQTSRLREDARRMIQLAVGGGPNDLVFFCGSGATAAVDKLVRVLNLCVPADLDAAYGLSAHIPADERPVVFIGPYEHHSNELPWRESIADVVMIQEDEDGLIDQNALEQALQRYAGRKLKIGSFSAASNVTGILSDTVSISILLHRYGALSFWDYAAAGPYLPIEMHPDVDGSDAELAYKDAIFLSPHKFIGGPGTPGVLVARRELFRNTVPTVPGGGTVAWVAPWAHRYLDDPVHREEGGTPAIVESIRAGMVFQLKEAVGPALIAERERGFVREALAVWCRNPNLWVLGNPEVERLGIVSMLARHSGRYLHWNFVVALLNDLFGIQARGGCSCAGPYGHTLFKIGRERSDAIAHQVEQGCESIKPGWFRLGFNYFLTETSFRYIVDAVELIANEGWKLVPQYRMCPRSALWCHARAPQRQPLSLFDLGYKMGTLEYTSVQTTEPESALAGYLDDARAIFAAAADWPEAEVLDPQTSDEYEQLRWFLLPSEAYAELRRRAVQPTAHPAVQLG